MKILTKFMKWRSLILISLFFTLWFFCYACGIFVRPAEVVKTAPLLSQSNSFLNDGLVRVGFSAMQAEPEDKEMYRMIDDVVLQTLGEKGLSSIIKKGYRVVIKVNMVGGNVGAPGLKGRGVITDARIVRYIADSVREIIGFDPPADIKIIEACYSFSRNPSEPGNKQGFAFARVEEKDGDTVFYDANKDGILDGFSKARIINLDSLSDAERIGADIRIASGRNIRVFMPRFLQRKTEAGTNDYCDVFIGLPVWKSHVIAGITGALKLHYGLRPYFPANGDAGRPSHSGLYWGTNSMIYKKQNLIDYITAEHCFRTYDFALMDALCGNRRGPRNPSDGYKFKEDEAVDLIKSHVVMASRDPVALDTAATLLAGYRLDSIGLLKTADENGIGTCDPSRIEIYGLDVFSRHRIFLAKTYGKQKLYPFENGWGGAAVLPTVTNTPEILKQSGPEKIEGNIYRFSFEISSTNGIIREELWCNNEKIKILDSNDRQITADMSAWQGKDAEYSLAFWDNAFNCTISEAKNFLF